MSTRSGLLATAMAFSALASTQPEAIPFRSYGQDGPPRLAPFKSRGIKDKVPTTPLKVKRAALKAKRRKAYKKMCKR